MARRHSVASFGTVSHATMREQDLIPEFVSVLESMRLSRSHRNLVRSVASRMESEGYYERNDSTDDLQELFDALNCYAPSYGYFGSHPGDGSDFGYWLSESFEDDFDGLKVSDVSEIPMQYIGEVACINDHGNVTLYTHSRGGKLSEIWSVV